MFNREKDCFNRKKDCFNRDKDCFNREIGFSIEKKKQIFLMGKKDDLIFNREQLYLIEKKYFLTGNKILHIEKQERPRQ